MENLPRSIQVALTKRTERQFLLYLESELIAYIANFVDSEDGKVRPYAIGSTCLHNSFYRLITHKLCDYLQLLHRNSHFSDIIVNPKVGVDYHDLLAKREHGELVVLADLGMVKEVPIANDGVEKEPEPELGVRLESEEIKPLTLKLAKTKLTHDKERLVDHSIPRQDPEDRIVGKGDIHSRQEDFIESTTYGKDTSKENYISSRELLGDKNLENDESKEDQCVKEHNQSSQYHSIDRVQKKLEKVVENQRILDNQRNIDNQKRLNYQNRDNQHKNLDYEQKTHFNYQGKPRPSLLNRPPRNRMNRYNQSPEFHHPHFSQPLVSPGKPFPLQTPLYPLHQPYYPQYPSSSSAMLPMYFPYNIPPTQPYAYWPQAGTYFQPEFKSGPWMQDNSRTVGRHMGTSGPVPVITRTSPPQDHLHIPPLMAESYIGQHNAPGFPYDHETARRILNNPYIILPGHKKRNRKRS